jgi:two-component system OmpR family response regulator
LRILVAEDDTRISAVLQEALTAAGFGVTVQSDGEEAWFLGDTEAFDAIVLDLGLPTLDGLTVLKRWRRAQRNAPVLILTARGDWRERVDGIEAGADDYLVKPFRIEEVVARIRALIRRAAGFAAQRLDIGDLTFDFGAMQVYREGVAIPMPPQEYRLIAFLAHRRGRSVSQLEITEHLYAQDYERDSNAVEVLVGRVRRRLGSHVIVTRRGFGYAIGEQS